MCWTQKIFLFVVFVLCEGTRQSVHELMHIDLDSSAACFRRLNGTHQFGCSSGEGGNTGVIHIIYNHSDLNYFLKYSNNEDYMIVLSMEMFTEEVMEVLISKENIGGVLIIVEKDHVPEFYSPDDVCPNPLFSSCYGQKINPYGNRFLLTDWPFPMFLIDNVHTTAKIKQCYKDFNENVSESESSRPLCSIEMKSHMSAAVNSPTCLRRETEVGARVLKYCDPLGDQNILLPLGEFDKPTRNVILIGARLDAASLFNEVSPGAISSATAIVGLLTIANILSSTLKDNNDKQVLFILFNGESHDYIGSSRIVYDLKNGDFSSMTSLNISLDSIAYFIELSQIDSSRTVYLHTTGDNKIEDLERELMYVGSNYSLNMMTGTLEGIPPSSLQTFIHADPSISGLVISNYDKQFTNKYFNGLLDNSKIINYDDRSKTLHYNLIKNIADLSSTISKSVYKTVTGTAMEVDEKSTQNLVSDLLECYLETRACKLMKAVNSGDESILTGGEGPWSLYVSVKPSPNLLTTFTGLILAYLTSPRVNATKENCVVDSDIKTYSYIFISGPNNTGLCLNTTLKFTPALSPAFIIPNYDWESKNYSTWTESIWSEISIGMFLKPSRKQEIVTFCCGLAVSLVSFIAVFWLSKNADILFASGPQTCSLLSTSC